MKNKRVLLFSLLISLFGFLAFIPREDGGIEKLVSALQRWTEVNPQEKIHLHMDKPYYALGDTIWFKAYVTVGSRHQLSAQSQAMYVDLINEKDSIVQTLKLPVIAGLSMGDFTLDDDLNDGNYRIRAYTQWMRNAAKEYFFDRTFTVGSPGGEGVVAKVDYQYTQEGEDSKILASLNYKDDNGRPLSDSDVRYDLLLNNKVIYTKGLKTDASGNVSMSMNNDAKLQAGSVFLRTTIFTREKRKVIKTFPVKAALAASDVQFFPEGGTLVTGITSRLGFKAVGIDGAGLNIKGVVLDNLNNEVISFESQHAGMGSFQLKPENGKRYKAQITYQDGSVAMVEIPAAQAQGYTLSVYQTEKDSVLVRVSTTAGLVKNPVKLGLIAQSGGETIYASSVTVSQEINSLRLPRKSFPTGIAQFTLFDYKNDPVAERVMFIRNPDQMKLKVRTAKTTYKSREKVDIELESVDPTGKPVAGNFSVSVIDESKVPVEESKEHTIFSNILLTADLKGYVEQPNYYFTADNDTVNRALDNLMLTQGYRRFSWKEISREQSSAAVIKPVFKAESIGMDISGKVLTLGGQPVPKGKVVLMSVRSGIMRDTITDDFGRFSFEDMVLTDSIRFAVQAMTEKNSRKVEIVLDTLPKISLDKNPNLPATDTDISGRLANYLDNIREQDKLLVRAGGLSRVQRLNEVVIRARKLESTEFSAQLGTRVPDGHADQTFVLDNPNSCPSLGICLQGRLAGVSFIQLGTVRSFPHTLMPGNPGPVPMQVFLDGRKIEAEAEISDIFDNNLIDPLDIGKIEVVRRSLPLMDMLGGPTILIITKRGTIRRRYEPSVANIRPKGYNKVKEFYSPRYEYTNLSRGLPDLRSTIYWNANVRTHGLGKTSLSYYNADGPGRYKVTVEGINAAGELARTVYRYEVEEATNVFQAQVNHSNAVVASLDSMQKRLPVEKVYLHTDKPYYNLGDTLWFKSYLLNATNFRGSSMSKFLYVELVDDSTEVVRRISVPVSDGLGWAQIPLSTTIFHEGAYTLRAYTNWMQNFGSDYIFTRRLYLGKPSINTWLVKSNAKIKNMNSQDQLEVSLQLKRSDNSFVGLKDLEVRIYEGDKYLTKQELRTSQDGELKFSSKLREKADGRNIRVEIRNKNKVDGNQMLQVPLQINRGQFIDLQFLPEGGQLVAGLPSLVGFKAIGEDGKGINVMGKIFDSSGAEAGTFASLHNGMGSFDFTPRPDDSYTAKIMLPEEVGKVYPLPVVNREGTLLRVRNNQDSIRIELAASNNAVDMDSVYYLLGTSRGKAYYSNTVDFGKAGLTISKNTFPSGIARFTLLKGKRPLNERIIFIDHKDQLDVEIKPSKFSYLQRDSVSLILAVKDRSGIPVKGSFSLSVTDDSQVKPDSLGNYGIAASLLLNSDLKGTVENPGYYLSGNDPQRLEALDNLMLTQGWTGYDWKDVFVPIVAPKFLAEKEFKVTGTVVNISNKPVSGAQVLISSQKPSFITTTVTDANGRYTFKDLPQIDSGSFFIQSRTAKGKSMNFGGIDVERFQPAPVPPTFRDQLMPWYVNSDVEQLNYVQQMARKTKEEFLRQSGVRLEEVKIVAKKIIKGSFNRNGPGNADLVFDEKDIKESAVMNLYQLIKQKLPGFRVVMEDGLPTLKYNNYMVTIEIDQGPLPLQLNANPSVEELVAGLSEFKIAGFIGLEVMYSRKYMNAYARPPKIITYTGAQIMDSEFQVRSGAYEFDDRNFDGVQADVSPFYIHGFKGSGYLDARVNVLTNKTREIAVINITTTTKRGWHRINKPDVVSYRPLPIMKAQEFYSPKYSINPSDIAEPDLRSAIFWEPNIVTDANGTARVSFYSADIPGSYTVTLEGVGKDGNVGSKDIKIKVGNESGNTKR